VRRILAAASDRSARSIARSRRELNALRYYLHSRPNVAAHGGIFVSSPSKSICRGCRSFWQIICSNSPLSTRTASSIAVEAPRSDPFPMLRIRLVRRKWGTIVRRDETKQLLRGWETAKRFHATLIIMASVGKLPFCPLCIFYSCVYSG